MKIAVITDSSAGLTPEQANAYGITVINDPIMFGNHVYHENVDMTTDQFYRMLKSEKEIPTIAQVPMEAVQVVFDDLVQQGYDAALVIGLSSGISGYINNLRAYVPSVKDLSVQVFDSRTIGAGTGDLALLAAAMVHQGYALPKIIENLTLLRAETKAQFIVNSMRHLVKNGRIYNNSSMVGTMMLRNKPIIEFNPEGKLQVLGKERTLKNAWEAIKQQFKLQVQQSDAPLRLNIVAASDQELIEDWASEMRYECPAVKVVTGEIGPLMGVLTGDHALGVIYTYDWEQWLTELNAQGDLKES